METFQPRFDTLSEPTELNSDAQRHRVPMGMARGIGRCGDDPEIVSETTNPHLTEVGIFFAQRTDKKFP